jgi:nucleoside-diphosphate-sugar epimerase
VGREPFKYSFLRARETFCFGIGHHSPLDVEALLVDYKVTSNPTNTDAQIHLADGPINTSIPIQFVLASCRVLKENNIEIIDQGKGGLILDLRDTMEPLLMKINEGIYKVDKVEVVIGTGGFLGINLVKELLKRKKQVVVFDPNLKDGMLKSFEDLKIAYPENLRLVTTHVLDLDFQEFAEAAKVEKIPLDLYYLSTTEKPLSDEQAIYDNVLGVLKVLEVAKGHKVRMVVTSSNEVYEPKPGPIDPNSALKISTPLITSQICCDLLVRSYRETYGMDTKVVRYGELCGQNEPANYPLSMIFRASREGAMIRLQKDRKRQLVPVAYCVSRLLDVMENDEGKGVTHIGGLLLSDEQLLKKISVILSKKIAYTIGDIATKIPKILSDKDTLSESHFDDYLRNMLSTMG